MLVPKEVGPIYRKAFVVNVVGSGLNEWRVLSNNDEQDDSCGERELKTKRLLSVSNTMR